MTTQPLNNNIEVSFEPSTGCERYGYFTKAATYKEVCEIFFANDFMYEVRKHVHFVHSLDVNYILKMRIGKVILRVEVPQNVVFNIELLREMFSNMQRVLISSVIDKVWEDNNEN